MAYIYDLTDTWNAGGTTFYGIKMNVTNTASASGSKLLSLQVGGSEQFGVDKNGNVGIGTSSPGQKLDVSGAIRAATDIFVGTGITTGAGVSTGDVFMELGGQRTGSGNCFVDFHSVASTDYESRIIRESGTNGALQVINTGTGAFNLVQAGAAPLVFQTSNTERMRIDSSGNVGIGTSSPGVKLDVIGTVRSTSFTALGTTAFQPQTSMTNWAADATGGYYIFYKGRAGGTTSQNGDTIGTLLWYGHDSGNASVATSSIAVTQTGAASAGVVPTAITFNNGGNVERMRITNAGNIGIGTSSPGAKLDVSSTTDNIVVSRSTSGYAAFQRVAPSGQQAYDFYTINGVEAGRITVDGGNFMAFSTGASATERMRITAGGDIWLGKASLPTNATTGFPYIPTCAGTPTGTPAGATGFAPMVVDSTNNKLYVYIGGAWQAMN